MPGDLGAGIGALPVAIRMVFARSRSPVAIRRTVWASSSTARLATILTFARSSADV